MNKDRNTRRALTVAAVVALAFLLSLNVAQAAEIDEKENPGQITQTFKVSNMTCATCPLTVRAAMRRLDGVISVAVDLETEIATVVFDPVIVRAEDIAGASTNVGFPATVLE